MRFTTILLTACAVMLSQCNCATARAALSFPRDYGVHDAFAREWWTLNCHLATSGGRLYSVQAAFFRFAVDDDEDLFSAQYSILDRASGRMESGERSAREKRASDRSRYAVRVGSWTISTAVRSGLVAASVGSDDRAARDGFLLRLLPQKKPTASFAFHGYAVTRLAATGVIEHDGVRLIASGTAWLDHEYESSQTSPRIGWERFELQLNDGRDIELFASRLQGERYGVISEPRRLAGVAPEQTPEGMRVPIEGFVLDRNGRRRALARDAVALVIRANTLWHSARDDATYPALWQLTLDDGYALKIEPTVRDQEIVPTTNGVALWYGSVTLADADPPGTERGAGFVELTGFSTPSSL